MKNAFKMTCFIFGVTILFLFALVIFMFLFAIILSIIFTNYNFTYNWRNFICIYYDFYIDLH